jgi:ATP-dependent helicase/DNAse subunit B
MAEYIQYKKKSFKLQKEATAWIKAEKKAYGGTKPVKIETNYEPGDPFPWTGVVLLKDESV